MLTDITKINSGTAWTIADDGFLGCSILLTTVVRADCPTFKGGTEKSRDYLRRVV
jgi:hypothetical protein